MNTQLNFKQSILAGLMASGVSVIINSILFLVSKTAGIITDDIFIQPNQPLTIVPIIISSILPTLIGACVFFLLEKYTNNGWKIFSIIAVVLLVLSFINPFVGIPGITIMYGIVLNVMHVVVAGALLYFIKNAKN
jgi:hypothetical protein